MLKLLSKQRQLCIPSFVGKIKEFYKQKVFSRYMISRIIYHFFSEKSVNWKVNNFLGVTMLVSVCIQIKSKSLKQNLYVLPSTLCGVDCVCGFWVPLMKVFCIFPLYTPLPSTMHCYEIGILRFSDEWT